MVGIVEFYRGQDLFVTGATGFLGKVLIEKILRSCPDVGNIYILIRPKRGKNIHDRIKEIFSLPLFDQVRDEKPENFKKIVPLQGDCRELGLGLSPGDRKLLEERVSIVFHGAATVRFDEPLKSAVVMNTRGTREVMVVVRNMKKLKSMVHISTTYCNCDRSVVEEVVYPPHADWREMIDIAENIDEHTLLILEPKIRASLPNTYTFTKSLAEHVVKDLGENLPVVIFRPSIVISTISEPFPGWMDSIYGPIAFLIGGGKGVLRTVYGNPDIQADLMPVDACIKGMLIASWCKYVSRNNSEISVYNSSSHNLQKITNQEVIDTGLDCYDQNPFDNILWMPRAKVTNCKPWFFLNMILVHLLPALLIDGLLKLSGKKPMLLNIQRKIFIANMSLILFIRNTWHFSNDNFLGLNALLPPGDKKHFDLDCLRNIDLKEYFKHAIIGGRRFILKEPLESLPKARQHYKRLYWIDKTVHVIAITAISWFVYHSALLQSTIPNMVTSLIFG